MNKSFLPAIPVIDALSGEEPAVATALVADGTPDPPAPISML
jgi:hypothetical protein